jgi:hypothetical protein
LLVTASPARRPSTGINQFTAVFLEEFTFQYARERLFKAFQLVPL